DRSCCPWQSPRADSLSSHRTSDVAPIIAALEMDSSRPLVAARECLGKIPSARSYSQYAAAVRDDCIPPAFRAGEEHHGIVGLAEIARDGHPLLDRARVIGSNHHDARRRSGMHVQVPRLE